MQKQRTPWIPFSTIPFYILLTSGEFSQEYVTLLVTLIILTDGLGPNPFNLSNVAFN